jgi:hypothetical protein
LFLEQLVDPLPRQNCNKSLATRPDNAASLGPQQHRGKPHPASDMPDNRKPKIDRPERVLLTNQMTRCNPKHRVAFKVGMRHHLTVCQTAPSTSPKNRRGKCWVGL